MNKDEVKKIALIDADSLIYYCTLGNKESSPTLEDAIIDINSRIDHMVDTCGASHYMLFLSKKYSNFRHRLVVSYKSNRPKKLMPPIFVAGRVFMEQKPSFICQDYEADDAVGIFRTLLKEYFSFDSVICSPDKDVLYQLEGTHYNYGKGELVTTTQDEAFKFLHKQTLMGDTTDGIQGIPKVGDKTSDKMLNAIEKEQYSEFCFNKYCEHFGMLEGIRKFSDTFRQVYLLRSNEDLLRECSYQFEIEQMALILEKYLLKYELAW
jgi:hypothetical protein